MTCLSDANLERFVLGSLTPGQEEREHIFDCDRCRERVGLLAALNQEFAVREETVSHGIERLFGEATPELPVISLHPMQSGRHTPDRFYRLAAQGERPVEKFDVFSFSNPEKGIVGRVLCDKESREVSLFLIAEDMQKVKGQKVTLVDTDLEAITDDEGRAQFGKQPDFKCSNIQIQSPLATFDLSPHQIETRPASRRHSGLLKNAEHDEITLEIDKSSEPNSYRISIVKIKGTKGKKELQVVAFTDQERTLSQSTKKGVTVLETDGPESILRIHIF